LLDIQGKQASSTQLADKLETLAVKGVSHVVFVIGGSDGVTPAVRARCNERLSFGPITLPHNLARVVLLEQIYRAHKIIRREPYHK
jgi:23S rRNA (pseudouridine1915-N3)-methyltransferase